MVRKRVRPSPRWSCLQFLFYFQSGLLDLGTHQQHHVASGAKAKAAANVGAEDEGKGAARSEVGAGKRKDGRRRGDYHDPRADRRRTASGKNTDENEKGKSINHGNSKTATKGKNTRNKSEDVNAGRKLHENDAVAGAQPITNKRNKRNASQSSSGTSSREDLRAPEAAARQRTQEKRNRPSVGRLHEQRRNDAQQEVQEQDESSYRQLLESAEVASVSFFDYDPDVNEVAGNFSFDVASSPVEGTAADHDLLRYSVYLVPTSYNASETGDIDFAQNSTQVIAMNSVADDFFVGSVAGVSPTSASDANETSGSVGGNATETLLLELPENTKIFRESATTGAVRMSAHSPDLSVYIVATNRTHQLSVLQLSGMASSVRDNAIVFANSTLSFTDTDGELGEVAGTVSLPVPSIVSRNDFFASATARDTAQVILSVFAVTVGDCVSAGATSLAVNCTDASHRQLLAATTNFTAEEEQSGSLSVDIGDSTSIAIPASHPAFPAVGTYYTFLAVFVAIQPQNGGTILAAGGSSSPTSTPAAVASSTLTDFVAEPNPIAANATCTLTTNCEITVTRDSTFSSGLTSRSRILILDSGETCGTTNTSHFAVWEGTLLQSYPLAPLLAGATSATVEVASSSSGTTNSSVLSTSLATTYDDALYSNDTVHLNFTARFALGIAASGPVGGDFKICWVAQEENTGNSFAPETYTTEIGSFAMRGPSTVFLSFPLSMEAPTVTCRVGLACIFAIPDYHGLAAENSIIVMDKAYACGDGANPLAGTVSWLDEAHRGPMTDGPVNSNYNRYYLGAPGDRADTFVKLHGFKKYRVCWAASFNQTAAELGLLGKSEILSAHSLYIADIYLDISYENSPDKDGLGIGLGSFERFSSAPTSEVFVSSTTFLVEWTVDSGPDASKILFATYDPGGNSFCCWNSRAARGDPRFSIQDGRYVKAVSPRPGITDTAYAIVYFDGSKGVQITRTIGTTGTPVTRNLPLLNVTAASARLAYVYDDLVLIGEPSVIDPNSIIAVPRPDNTALVLYRWNLELYQEVDFNTTIESFAVAEHGLEPPSSINNYLLPLTVNADIFALTGNGSDVTVNAEGMARSGGGGSSGSSSAAGGNSSTLLRILSSADNADNENCTNQTLYSEDLVNSTDSGSPNSTNISVCTPIGASSEDDAGILASSASSNMTVVANAGIFRIASGIAKIHGTSGYVNDTVLITTRYGLIVFQISKGYEGARW